MTHRTQSTTVFLLSLLLALHVSLNAGAQAPPTRQEAATEEIDFERARQLLEKQRQGQQLTDAEKAYLDRARAARRGRTGADRQRDDRPAGKPSVGLVPLTDLPADAGYKGQDGGLYGGGRNEPPKPQLDAALRAAAEIQPLSAGGQPSSDGKIVLVSNGMSNTTQEFSRFVQLANRDADKSPHVVIVDCAQGGQEASDWAYPEKRFRQERGSPWDQMDRRLQQAGVTAEQVQVVWIKQARRNPKSLGEFPDHAREMKNDLVVVLNRLKERCPNLKIAYLSSRIYAGYATTALNPEPYAYESAFTVRWLIADQIEAAPALNYDPQRGPVKSPILLWGPYLWADGVKGRKVDDLVYVRDDLAGDGTHPSDTGRQKVAEQLLRFMKTDATARSWFVGKE